MKQTQLLPNHSQSIKNHRWANILDIHLIVKIWSLFTIVSSHSILHSNINCTWMKLIYKSITSYGSIVMSYIVIACWPKFPVNLNIFCKFNLQIKNSYENIRTKDPLNLVHWMIYYSLLPTISFKSSDLKHLWNGWKWVKIG